ncbi:MAG TPA: PucR family transcriptional regulator [Solirubrobacteraceae bacterium]|nr:PucR family transcriptional regulator [Solirubrobacteraceae bacterium]
MTAGSFPMTVAAALQLPALRRGAPLVVAGRDQLDRRVRWAHSSEVPNIPELLRGDELLLMTGMGIGVRAASQRAFVRELSERRIAALAIELGQVFTSVPTALVAESERCGLPLIVLRKQVRFVDVTEQLHSAILSQELELSRRTDELRGRLTALMLEGAAIPEILAALAAAIHNPVLLVRAGGEVLYHAAHRSEPDVVLAEWELLRDGCSAESGRPVASSPVMAARGRVWGTVTALGLDAPLDEFAAAAVERTVALVALALVRGGQESLLVSRERGNFLADLVDGRLVGADAEQRAAALGFRARGRLLAVALMASDRLRPEQARDEAGWAATWRTVRGQLSAHGIEAIIGVRAAEADALLVANVRRGELRAGAIERIVAAIQAAAARHVGPSDAVVIAVGRAVDDWEHLPDALREAAYAAAAARGGPARPWHDATVPDVERLLWALRGDAPLRAFVEQRLAPVVAHDRTRAAKLLPTLEALCEHRWHKAGTARALAISRQTLYPRIERLEQLLAADLEDPETRLGLELSVRARRHLAI